MKHVYIIHHGKYDDYSVDLVVENEKVAQKIIDKLNINRKYELYSISKRWMPEAVDEIVEVDIFMESINIPDEATEVSHLIRTPPPIHSVKWNFELSVYLITTYWEWMHYTRHSYGNLCVYSTDRAQVNATLKDIVTKLLSDPTMRMSAHLTSEGNTDV